MMQSCYTVFFKRVFKCFRYCCVMPILHSNLSTTVDIRASLGVSGVQTGVSWVPLHGMQHSVLAEKQLLTSSYDVSSCLSYTGTSQKRQVPLFVSILKKSTIYIYCDQWLKKSLTENIAVSILNWRIAFDVVCMNKSLWEISWVNSTSLPDLAFWNTPSKWNYGKND